MVRELRDGEDVDQVEEQLDWLDLGLLFVPLAQPAEVAPLFTLHPFQRGRPKQTSRCTLLILTPLRFHGGQDATSETHSEQPDACDQRLIHGEHVQSLETLFGLAGRLQETSGQCLVLLILRRHRSFLLTLGQPAFLYWVVDTIHDATRRS